MESWLLWVIPNFPETNSEKTPLKMGGTGRRSFPFGVLGSFSVAWFWGRVRIFIYCNMLYDLYIIYIYSRPALWWFWLEDRELWEWPNMNSYPHLLHSSTSLSPTKVIYLLCLNVSPSIKKHHNFQDRFFPHGNLHFFNTWKTWWGFKLSTWRCCWWVRAEILRD